jgi:Flp pilus assembly protein TadB
MVAAILAIAAVTCLGVAISPRRRHMLPVTLARLSTMSPREAARHKDSERPVWERLLQPLVALLRGRVRLGWAGLGVDDLRRAGIDPSQIGVEEILALKLVGALGGAALVLLGSTMAPSLIILLPAASFGGFLAPSVVITRRRQARRRALLRELPDLVGLLKAFVTAGIPLEQALHLISAQHSHAQPTNLLATEIRRALSEYGLGMTIEEALNAMAHRVGVDELEMLTASLAQGKRQGAGMERILRDQETVIRMQQRNRAAAEASRVGTRLVGVLVLVYLPEFMVLIMIPLFYGIFLRAFG